MCFSATFAMAQNCEYVKDLFDAFVYDNQDGSINWTSDWVETGDDGNPTTGDVAGNTGFGNSLRFDHDDSTPPCVERDFAFTIPATSIMLNMAYAFSGLPPAPYDADDIFTIEISDDAGATYTNLGTISGANYPDAYNSIGENDDNFSADISSFSGSNLSIRLCIGSNAAFRDASEFFYIQYIEVVACQLGVDVTTSVSSAICNLAAGTGSITVVGYNGVPPFQYSIDGVNFQTSELFAGLEAGNYTVTVRDANGVEATTTHVISADSEAVQPVSCSVTVTGATATSNDYYIDFVDDVPIVTGGDETTNANITGNVLNLADGTDAGFDYNISAIVSGGPGMGSSVNFFQGDDPNQTFNAVHQPNNPSVSANNYIILQIKGADYADIDSFYRDPTSQMKVDVTLGNGTCFENTVFSVGDIDYALGSSNVDGEDYLDGEPNNYNNRSSYIDRVRFLTGIGTNNYSMAGSNINLVGDIATADFTDLNGNGYPDTGDLGLTASTDPAGYFTIVNNTVPLTSLSYVYDDPGYGIESDADRLHDFDRTSQLHTIAGPITFSQIIHSFCNNESATLEACSDLTDVTWFNSSDVQVGTGNSLIASISTDGLADSSESFYYTATDANGCDVNGCPIFMSLIECCPPVNCINQFGEFTVTKRRP